MTRLREKNVIETLASEWIHLSTNWFKFKLFPNLHEIVYTSTWFCTLYVAMKI